MRRRDVFGVAAGAGLAWPRAAWAQSSKPKRLGILDGGTPSGTRERDKCFDDGLRRLGWIEGQNIVVERRWANGDTARVPGLAAELIRLSPISS